MQLPRVVIAAVFFVIGALIAVPALIRTTGSSNASEAPPGAAPTTTSPTSARPTTTRPSPTRTTPRPTRTTTRPVPVPTTPRTTAPVVDPLTVNIGSVDCPGRTVRVTVTNTSGSAQDYTVDTDDGQVSKGGTVPARGNRTTVVTLREDRRTRITVTWRNEPVRQETHTANCRRRTASPEPTTPPEDRLPNTGPDAVLWARTATGLAAMVTGVIIFWYGGIWPRRRDPEAFGKKK